jgi:uncharacterized protein (TIGR00106 family)
MLIEFSILPLGSGTHLSGEIAEVLKIVDDSGLPYQLTPAGTILEGEWDEVMAVIKRSHEWIRQKSSHVVTSIRIEDDEGATDKIRRNVESVQEKAGRPSGRMDRAAKATA